MLCFVKKRPFFKKNCFLDLNKTSTLLGNPSALLTNEGALLLKLRALFKKNLNNDHENRKLTTNAHNALRICCETFDYELQIKLPLFHVFHGFCGLNF